MEDKIREIIKKSKAIAIVGLSDDPGRDSYGIAGVLKKSGYTIVPVNPNISESHGEKSYPDLKSVPVDIDIVNIFRNPEYVPGHIDEALETGAHTIWLQTGITVSDRIAGKVGAAGKTLIQDRCLGVAVRTLA
jgi:uncharacterized protein